MSTIINARTSRGWLRVSALLAGLQEQAAFTVEATKTAFVVTLRHNAQDDTFRVNTLVDSEDQEFPEGEETVYPARQLDNARTDFARRVANLRK